MEPGPETNWPPDKGWSSVVKQIGHRLLVETQRPSMCCLKYSRGSFSKGQMGMANQLHVFMGSALLLVGLDDFGSENYGHRLPSASVGWAIITPPDWRWSGLAEPLV